MHINEIFANTSAQVQLRIPTSGALSSLNLAAAVQLVCYEIRMALAAGTEGASEAEALPAQPTHAELEIFYTRLREALDSHDYFKAVNPTPTFTKMRRIFGRARPDAHELKVLHGLIKKVTDDTANTNDFSEASKTLDDIKQAVEMELLRRAKMIFSTLSCLGRKPVYRLAYLERSDREKIEMLYPRKSPKAKANSNKTQSSEPDSSKPDIGSSAAESVGQDEEEAAGNPLKRTRMN